MLAKKYSLEVMIKILIEDDHSIIRSALVNLITVRFFQDESSRLPGFIHSVSDSFIHQYILLAFELHQCLPDYLKCVFCNTQQQILFVLILCTHVLKHYRQTGT